MIGTMTGKWALCPQCSCYAETTSATNTRRQAQEQSEPSGWITMVTTTVECHEIRVPWVKSVEGYSQQTTQMCRFCKKHIHSRNGVFASCDCGAWEKRIPLKITEVTVEVVDGKEVPGSRIENKFIISRNKFDKNDQEVLERLS